MSALLGEFMRVRGRELTERGVAPDARHVVNILLDYMEGKGSQDMPTYKVDQYLGGLNALLSLHVLVEAHRKITFAHQSMADYLLAGRIVDRMDQERRPFAEWGPLALGQDLAVRHWVRHVLDLLRDRGERRYVGSGNSAPGLPEILHLPPVWRGPGVGSAWLLGPASPRPARSSASRWRVR